jgi:2-polyprenyl-6-hydroxyphenyl methylase/3-demethylubiquinone-9 3-methyltransferase
MSASPEQERNQTNGPAAGGFAAGASVDPDEVGRFAAMAAEWWDPNGKFRPIHKFNPVRLQFIREAAVDHFSLDPAAMSPFDGLRVVDIGCGGGLLAEPVARLGALVTGIDAAADNIGTAAAHAAQSGLDIDYRCMTAEALLEEGAQYDMVLNMEVVEHVADRDGFLATSAALMKPGGLMIVATLNRTAKSFALAIVGAEYVLRWLPRGTHDWRRFVRPSELARGLRDGGAQVSRFAGVTYSPLTDKWRITRDLDVNYMAVATR